MKIQLMQVGEDVDPNDLGFITTDGNAAPEVGEKVSLPGGPVHVTARWWYVPEEDDNTWLVLDVV